MKKIIKNEELFSILIIYKNESEGFQVNCDAFYYYLCKIKMLSASQNLLLLFR
jgi:hypothetical protein